MEHDSKWTDSELIRFSDLLHKYNFMMRNSLQSVRDYGLGEGYTPIETHLVLDIEQIPGITVTELAKKRACSKSAITQAINRLEKKGLVQRAKSPDNQKTSLLFVTPKGRTLTQNHMKFDITDTQNLVDYLSQEYSEQDIRTFFSIIGCLLQLGDDEYPV